MASGLTAPQFQSEEQAFAYVEARLWPEGPVCPHCGGVERISKMQGKSTRMGLYKCYQCRKPFTVRMGTIFESSHVPLHIWLQAIFFVAGSKKGGAGVGAGHDTGTHAGVIGPLITPSLAALTEEGERAPCRARSD